jgi:hypothetical protein
MMPIIHMHVSQTHQLTITNRVDNVEAQAKLPKSSLTEKPQIGGGNACYQSSQTQPPSTRYLKISPFKVAFQQWTPGSFPAFGDKGRYTTIRIIRFDGNFARFCNFKKYEDIKVNQPG